MTDLEEIQRAARRIVMEWLRACPMLDEEGRPLLRDDGTPVALEVLNVIRQLSEKPA